MINLLAKLTIVASLACALPAAAAAAGQRDGRHAHPRAHPRVDAQQTGSIPGGGHHRRDPLGIIQGQGVSSLHGGMGNMGGGSGRSANTGVGLGAHGNSQGPRH